MSNDRSRLLLLASVAIAALMSGGLLHRGLAVRWSGSIAQVEAPTGILQTVPYTIGEWQGDDDPLDPSVIAAIDAPEHLSRVYRRVHGLGRVHLFVSLGGRFRDLAPHRPEVCFPGAGWNLVQSTQEQLNGVFGDGGPLPYMRYRFRKSGFNSGEVTVLSYYAVGHEVGSSLSGLIQQARSDRSTLNRILRIQLTSEPQITDPGVLVDFAAASAESIRAAVEDPSHSLDLDGGKPAHVNDR